jgi:hypothetical protein
MQNSPAWMAHVGIGQFIFYAAPFLLLGNHFTSKPATSGMLWGFSRAALRRGYLTLLVVTLMGATLMVGRIVVHTIFFPPAWDFQGLWLYGKIVDAGQNPYLPASFHALAGPGPFVEHFREEELDVGAVYPPPSLLMFAAIGWLPMQVAVVPWMMVQIAAFIAMIVLLRRMFFRGEGWEGWAFILTLALLLSGTIATFGQAQISFIAVVCVLAAWRSRDRAASGVYLVVAAVMKLLYGFLWLYPVLRRRWTPLVGIAVAGTVAVVASIAALGWKVFATYLFDNPVSHRMPSYYFTISGNQSLLGACLRIFPYHRAPFGPPIGHPAYIVSAVIAGVVTGWAVVRQPRTPEGEDTAYVLLILGGMLIYPWTLSNYFVLLLVPMGFLWLRRANSPIGAGWTIILLSAVYPITYYRLGGYAIVATILLWFAILAIAVHAIRASHAAQREREIQTATPAIS